MVLEKKNKLIIFRKKFENLVKNGRVKDWQRNATLIRLNQRSRLALVGALAEW